MRGVSKFWAEHSYGEALKIKFVPRSKHTSIRHLVLHVQIIAVGCYKHEI